MHSCSNVDTSSFKKGFNNKYISFQHPFTWEYLENDSEFVVAKLFDKKYQSVITISVAPCITNDIEEIKEMIEADFKERNWNIQDSKVLKENDLQAWDVIFTVVEEGRIFEIEQYNILKENNIYTIEIASFSRSEIMTDYVSLLTSFKILKPSYKVDGNSYEKI